MRQETQNRALHQDITFRVIMITFNKLRKFEIVCFLQQSQLCLYCKSFMTATLLKRDFAAAVFLLNLRNF